MKYTPYSYSKLSTFSCPHKFKLSYIDKIKVPNTNIALEKGTYIHHVLENYDSFKQSNFENFPEFKFSIMNTEEQQTAKDITINFINSDLGQYYLEDITLIGEETPFGLDKKLNPCDYNSPDAVLRGKIDKIIIKKDKHIIIDYKSGKYPEQQYHDNNQGILYALWYFRKNKEVDVIEMTYVFVEHNKEHKYIFKREYLQNYATTYSNKIKAIETEEEFDKKITKLCEYCDYYKQNICQINN